MTGTSPEMTVPSWATAVTVALVRLAAGGVVLVRDDTEREDEGDLVAGADTMTSEQMAFFVRHGTGIVCVPMDDATADRLDLPLMVTANTDNHHQTAFTVPVDFVLTGTGVSAKDRAATARALADPATPPDSLRRPGHVFPLRARPRGVIDRAGHTEAAVDLLRLAGRTPVGVITELVDGDDPRGGMLRGVSLHRFARRHAVPVVSIADLVRYRGATGSM